MPIHEQGRRLRRAVKHYRANGRDLQPHMSLAEGAVYARLVDEARCVLEFGTGGSTLVATRSGTRCLSVESDPAWVLYLRWLPEIRRAEQAGELRFLVPDLGPVGEWGYPTDTHHRPNHPAYSLGPHGLDETWQPDLVLADGRFRLACAMAALWYRGPDVTVAVHDFWPREHYHGLLDYVDVVERVDTLGVFRASSDLDRGRVANYLMQALYDPR